MEEYHSENMTINKKRMRATQACILCRKKKIKCDGTKPFCLHCQESNLECEYTESKKRGPRKGYVQVLEDRLAQLEKMLVVSDKKGIQSTEYDDLPDPEIVTHLIDLFFRYINSVFPFVHRGRLKQSIVDKTVSKPLLWSVMATAARFSDHPSIKTDPPYLASEKFALKANSLINASLLEPTLPNIQFWGIMSCLEYGSASGSKAWIYGGIAVRLCQELGINKEEVLKTPIKAPDGSTDYLGMALRRRIFWSCFCIDKFSSTSTDRPQGFEIGDYDVRMPTITESRLIRDSLQAYTVDRVLIDDDPLMGSIDYYLSILEIFGEISKYMSRVKTDSTAVIWPPIKEHGDLHKKIRQWAINLPEIYRYTPANVSMYRKAASENYLNFWLCSHAIYCAGMLALHRGSLAYGDLSACELSFGTYERMQESIVLCKEHVDIAMDVFSKLRDFCDCNVLPYMGYSAYIFLTALMTSTFSSDSASYSRSNTGLIILYDTIKLLCPYWKMGDRLTAATQDMLKAHSKLYDVRDQEKNKRQNEYTNNQFTQLKKTNSSPEITSSSASTEGTMLFSQTASSTTSEVPFPTTFMSNGMQAYAYNQPQSLDMSNSGIDFGSSDFLYDSALFGQMILDTSRPAQATNNLFGYYSSAPTSSTAPHPVAAPLYQQSPYSFSHQQ